jgi:hypothetical protein
METRQRLFGPGKQRVGCKYSVHRPFLQVRDSSELPPWSEGGPPKDDCGPSQILAEPSLNAKHSTLMRSGAPARLDAQHVQTGG